MKQKITVDHLQIIQVLNFYLMHVPNHILYYPQTICIMKFSNVGRLSEAFL